MAYTTIKKPSDYFNTKLYTGNGSTQSITGVGFQPDWVWTKKRSAGEEHIIYDSVRGVYKYIKSDGTDAESNVTTSLTSFDSDGFTLGSSWNTSGATYASWNWLASNTTASNTDGDITSTVSANTTSGFSIFSYTGTGASTATVGHGCSSEPKFVIVKNRSSTSDWVTYHYGAGATGLYNPNQASLLLNTTDASANPAGGGYLNNGYFSNVNSTTITLRDVGNDSNVNSTGNNYIGYAFAEVKGFSKFGSYTGNGNADGTFVYTGFKPAFFMLKRTDSTGDWQIQDSKRPEYNPLPFYLEANNSNAEVDWTSSFPLDFVSNGMKIRNSGTQMNTSGASYIYMAFAEEPLVGDNPATAR
jgi:hypothetical protein